MKCDGVFLERLRTVAPDPTKEAEGSYIVCSELRQCVSLIFEETYFIMTAYEKGLGRAKKAMFCYLPVSLFQDK